MSYNKVFIQQLKTLFENARQEDIGNGDHTTQACISSKIVGIGKLKIQSSGVVSGIEVVKQFLKFVNPKIQIKTFYTDGTQVKKDSILLEVHGKVVDLITSERIILNTIQRMTGISTLTNQYVQLIQKYPVKILDSRKTTPNIRILEKEAVRIGGGYNHRMGLFDAILIKDNHIDCTGGIQEAINKVNEYQKINHLKLPIILEVRNLNEVQEAIHSKKIQRILLDNFSPSKIKKALSLINGKIKTEASGGINLKNIVAYAQTGVDYISVGSLIHQAQSIDMNFKISLL